MMQTTNMKENGLGAKGSGTFAPHYCLFPLLDINKVEKFDRSQKRCIFASTNTID